MTVVGVLNGTLEMIEKRERAPEAKLSAERVSEPDAGMPPAMALARFAMPTANMSWLRSGWSPL